MERLSRMEVDSCVPTREGKAVEMSKMETVEMPKALVLTEGKVSVLSLEIRRVL
jgi:hypothetical protein